MSKPVPIKGLSDAAAGLVRAALETADPQGVEPRVARERIMGAKASIEVKNEALVRIDAYAGTAYALRFGAYDAVPNMLHLAEDSDESRRR